MTDNRPIGVFDSGVGGLSVWRQIAKLLPHESTLYVADSANCPYGPQPALDIVALSTGISRFLSAQQCKMVVVACNTASAAALAHLRAKFSIPFVGMEPAVKPAANATRTGHIGILATEGTFHGDLFTRTANTHARHVTVHRQVAHDLVDLVEAGEWAGKRAEILLRQYLDPMLAHGIDQLVLGCTHYPFLIPVMENIVGNQVKIIDPANAVAKQTYRVLAQNKMSAAAQNLPRHRFFSTGDGETFQNILQQIEMPNTGVELLTWREGVLGFI